MDASAAVITNPILRGFNPDPSIVRVGDDYYIATSTFEWFPGVQIHHSRDLGHWRLVARPLNRASQLDMRGDPDSCGVWAPCLTHADGLFHLIYTDVKRYGRTTTAGASGASLRDFHNYLVTSPRIDGEWSDPVSLNSSGFDPSLFHDDDGRKYLVNMLWDHRPGQNRFAGIVLQEYSPAQRTLVGGRRNIFTGTAIGFTEAPHLYKRDGWYYLLTAEGGTGWGHAVTMARSRTLLGPYELHPDTYVLSARHRPDLALQRAGHADLVETQSGETYMVYLCGRPLANRGRCTLGRETAIQPMAWGADGWLRTTDGDAVPHVEVPAPAKLTPQPPPVAPAREDFDAETLPIDFQWLRSPAPDDLFSLRARKSHLRLYGRETLGSLFTQALVARRQQAHCFSAAARMEFDPQHFQQMAGLVCYYNSAKFHYLYLSRDEAGTHLRVMSAIPDSVSADAFTPPIPIATKERREGVPGDTKERREGVPADMKERREGVPGDTKERREGVPADMKERREGVPADMKERREGVPADSAALVDLRVEVDFGRLRFAYRTAGHAWEWLPQQFDASILSDEASAPGLPNFTGAFVGMACQDLAGTARPADFDWFEYRERPYVVDVSQLELV